MRVVVCFTRSVIFEALFIALPFFLGLGVSAQRGGRALGALVVLEVLLFWLAATAFRQPLLAAAATTLVLGSLGFGGGLWFSRKRHLRAGAVPGLAFLGGVLLTGTLAGELHAPLRKETAKTAKWVDTSEDLARDALLRVGAQASERMTWLGESQPSPAATHLTLEPAQSELSRPLFRLTGADFWLTPQDGRTHLLRTTDYESRLVPTWLWLPIEERLLLSEHRAAMSELSGRFVAAEEPGVRVLLTVQTSPPTVVTIVPPSSSERPRLVLGRTPVVQRAGAQVGDTVMFENDERGINAHEVIEHGQPGELKVISKVFTRRR